MKKITIASVVVSSLFASQAFAQAKNFEGFNVAANMNFNSATTELTIGGTSLNGIGQQSKNASLQAAYSFAASDVILLSAGGTYNITAVDAGTIAGDVNATIKLENGASIYFEPGLVLSEKTLGYVKLSYNTGKAKATAVAGSISKDISGTGYGFGVRTQLTKNLFLQVEANTIQYDSARFAGDTTDFKPSATVGSVGIGYKF